MKKNNSLDNIIELQRGKCFKSILLFISKVQRNIRLL